MTNKKAIRFSNIDKTKFFRTLNKKVNTYFKENKLKAHRELVFIY